MNTSLLNKMYIFIYPKLFNGSVSHFSQKYEAALLFSTLKIIINVSWASNQRIRMISERCDTEDWSNDAENTALITGINYIFKYIQI